MSLHGNDSVTVFLETESYFTLCKLVCFSKLHEMTWPLRYSNSKL